MAEMYNHHTVEKKWQKVWDDEKAFHTPNDYTKPKFYALVEFPYPSGQGLHVGHPRPYTLPNGMGCFWSSNRELCDQK